MQIKQEKLQVVSLEQEANREFPLFFSKMETKSTTKPRTTVKYETRLFNWILEDLKFETKYKANLRYCNQQYYESLEFLISRNLT